MTTFTANFPAGLPLIAPLIAFIRRAAAPSRRAATVAAPAVVASVWSLYRMASADSVGPKVAAALAARATG